VNETRLKIALDTLVFRYPRICGTGNPKQRKVNETKPSYLCISRQGSALVNWREVGFLLDYRMMIFCWIGWVYNFFGDISLAGCFVFSRCIYMGEGIQSLVDDLGNWVMVIHLQISAILQPQLEWYFLRVVPSRSLVPWIR